MCYLEDLPSVSCSMFDPGSSWMRLNDTELFFCVGVIDILITEFVQRCYSLDNISYYDSYTEALNDMHVIRGMIDCLLYLGFLYDNERENLYSALNRCFDDYMDYCLIK